MKKIFTLIAAVAVALGVQAAKYSVGNPTNNATGTFDAATKTIHFLEANDYKPGWWLAWNNADNANTGQNFSDYTRFVIELSNIPEGEVVACIFEYVDESIAAEWAATDENGKITITLNEAGKSAVKQAFLQAPRATDDDGNLISEFTPFDVTFVDAYFENDEAEKTSVDLDFTTPVAPLDWGDNKVSATLSTDALALLAEGTYFGIDYTCEPYEDDEDSRYYQVQCMGAWWTLLEGAVGTNGAEKVTSGGNSNIIISLDAASTNVEFQLAAADVATLNNQKGILLAGHGIYVKRIYLSKESQAPVTAINTVKTAQQNAAVRYNLAGQQVDAAYKGVVIENGKKFIQK